MKPVDAAMIGVIVLSFLIFFAWLIFGGRVLLGGDAFSYSYPLRSLAWASMRNGELPLWTPEVLSGYPMLSMTQIALGYPLTWSYLFLPGYIAEQLYIFAPFLLAPCFTYAYARSLGRSPIASLLAGLAFGYGGAMTGLLGVIGLVGNSFMWLPLMLIQIDRVRTKNFPTCLLAATCAFAMSVLNGYAQAFVFVAFISFAYAAWVGFLSPASTTTSLIDRLRPLLLVLCSTLLAAGIAAFQIFETWQAAQLSIRKSLSFIAFADGSFSPTVALKSLAAPLYMDRFADVTAFVSPIAFGLALFAFVNVWRRPRSEETVRIKFWALVAIVAGLLILGSYTPLAQIAFYVPLLNKFRVPSRHVLEWTFALSILSAYGWDGIKLRWNVLQPKTSLAILALALLLATTATGYLWLRATTDARIITGVDSVGSWYVGLSITKYLIWKAVWLVLLLLCIFIVFHIRRRNFQMLLLTALVLLSCITEPYILFRNWWSSLAKTHARVQTPAPVTRALQTKANNRIYTRFDLFVDDTAATPRVDSQNLPALHGLRNVAGSEPLILERYSRALGNVGPDSVNEIPGNPPPDFIYNDNSHVLDILNTATVATFSDLRTTPKPLPMFDGVKLALNETGLELPPGSTRLIGLTNLKADTLVLITSMANSIDVEQGTSVGRLRLFSDSGHVIEKELRAGIDTSEWAHERPDVRAIIKHQQARVFDRQVGDAENSYQACRYVTRVPLENFSRVTRVELMNLTPRATIALWAASLLDTSSGESETLSRLMVTVRSNPQRWRIEPLGNDVLLLHNSRALPHAWLVTHAEAVDAEEALRRIKGESAQQLDPRRTALLEVAQWELPVLTGGDLADAEARVNGSNNQLRVETSASTATVLVVSEIFYPGWEATIDGEPAKILVTDYLLRGVALPAGKHVVEMRYCAPQARNGAIVSLISLMICGFLTIWMLMIKTHKS